MMSSFANAWGFINWIWLLTSHFDNISHMGIAEKVLTTIQKYSMLSQGDSVLIGLSGGPDSVCLLSILNSLKTTLGIHLFAAYIDHGLRPDETPHEIEFCKNMCSANNIPFQTKPIDVFSYSKKMGMSKQEAARDLRYQVLDGIALELGINKIALGHNADDQAETVLMRLFRGAGPSGLSGIPAMRGHIIRPLIEVERIEIEEFLDTEKICFMTDSSNLKEDYLRNKIRRLMMPEIKKINMDFIKTVSRTADIIRDEERYFSLLVTKTLMKLISRKGDNHIELFIAPLEIMDTVILRRVLRRAIDETRGLRGISFIHIEDIITLIKTGKSGDRIYLPEGARAIKKYSTLLITSEKPVMLGVYTFDSPGDVVLKEISMVIRSKIINISEFDYNKCLIRNIVFIDADKVSFPLIIRSRRHGDYFYPIGFGNRKKIQDYFVDEKIPRDERDSVPLITSNDNIVWVVGHRLDERYKVEKHTKRILQLEIRQMKK